MLIRLNFNPIRATIWPDCFYSKRKMNEMLLNSISSFAIASIPNFPQNNQKKNKTITKSFFFSKNSFDLHLICIYPNSPAQDDPNWIYMPHKYILTKPKIYPNIV